MFEANQLHRLLRLPREFSDIPSDIPGDDRFRRIDVTLRAMPQSRLQLVSICSGTGDMFVRASLVIALCIPWLTRLRLLALRERRCGAHMRIQRGDDGEHDESVAEEKNRHGPARNLQQPPGQRQDDRLQAARRFSARLCSATGVKRPMGVREAPMEGADGLLRLHERLDERTADRADNDDDPRRQFPQREQSVCDHR